jgi:hypothetical protein
MYLSAPHACFTFLRFPPCNWLHLMGDDTHHCVIIRHLKVWVVNRPLVFGMVSRIPLSFSSASSSLWTITVALLMWLSYCNAVYPTRNISLISPTSVGTAPDLLLRAMCNDLNSPTLHDTFLPNNTFINVVNIPGDGQLNGFRAIYNADDHTVSTF